MEKKNYKKNTFKKFQGDEESQPFISYEGGAADEKKPSEAKKSEAKKSEKKADLEDDAEVDDTHCCCKYTTAIMIYGIFLWLFGILLIANILVEFANQYFSWVYPFISLLLSLFYFAGLVLIAIFWCKDTGSTRTGLKVGGWLILGSVIALILWNVFYILNAFKHKANGVKVGTGDDPDDYDEESRSSYLLGYLLWGMVMITIDILLLCCAIGYADSFPPEDEEEETPAPAKKESPKKEKEPAAEDDKAPEQAEGGQLERRSAASRTSRRSSASVKSGTSAKAGKAAPPVSAARAAAFNEIDSQNTPRQSLNGNDISYENGKSSERIPFDQEQVARAPTEPTKNNRKRNNRKKNK